MKHRVLVYCCLLSSCASPQDAWDANRFDGDWQAVMRGTESVQLIEGLRFDCVPFTEPFFLRVQDGVASGFLQADENYSFTAPIDRHGRFRAQMPTNSVYTYKSDDVKHESAIVLSLQGRLSAARLSSQDSAGLFIVGDTALDGKGCSTVVQFVSV